MTPAELLCEALNAQARDIAAHRSEEFTNYHALMVVVSEHRMLWINDDGSHRTYRMPDGSRVRCVVESDEVGIGEGGVGFYPAPDPPGPWEELV